MGNKSKYYYDYTRNMSEEQIKNHCGRPTCQKTDCVCEKVYTEPMSTFGFHNEKEHTGFDAWIEDMENSEQPEQCSIDNPDCENCGS